MVSPYAGPISSIESGGNYSLLGPVVGNGDRAYGRYQVMGNNVGPWTEKFYGQRLTPQQFLDNPQAQDAVFNGQFGDYVQKYGPEGAARAWFAGEGGMNNPNAKDMLGTTVAHYAAKFNAQNQNPLAPGTPAPALPPGQNIDQPTAIAAGVLPPTLPQQKQQQAQGVLGGYSLPQQQAQQQPNLLASLMADNAPVQMPRVNLTQLQQMLAQRPPLGWTAQGWTPNGWTFG